MNIKDKSITNKIIDNEKEFNLNDKGIIQSENIQQGIHNKV